MLAVLAPPETRITRNSPPKPTDTAREVPLSAPVAESEPDAIDALRAVPDSAITVTTAPLAVDADTAMPDIVRAGRPGIDTSPKPWLDAELIPDIASRCVIAPVAAEGVEDVPETGPPASHPSA